MLAHEEEIPLSAVAMAVVVVLFSFLLNRRFQKRGRNSVHYSSFAVVFFFFPCSRVNLQAWINCSVFTVFLFFTHSDKEQKATPLFSFIITVFFFRTCMLLSFLFFFFILEILCIPLNIIQ